MAMTVVLVFGGLSRERLVSVASAQNVAAQIEPQPRCWFWTPANAVAEVSLENLRDHKDPFRSEFRASSVHWPTIDAALDTLVGTDSVVFPILHGGTGEDGTFQRLLEERRLAFVGSDSESSTKAFDKVRARDIVQARGGIVAESMLFHSATPEGQARDFFRQHRQVVLKPVRDGSSYGLIFSEEEDHFVAATRGIRASDGRERYLIEAFIPGQEVTVGVIDRVEGDHPVALPPVAIMKSKLAGFDYEAKYLGVGASEICPAPIRDEETRAAQQLGILAHSELKCYGFSRTDIILSARGPVFLELNTLPGLTAASLIPQELHAYGIAMPEFIAEQIELARRRVAIS